MYTNDDRKENLYEDEYVENSTWDNNKGLIFKIIIIVLCVIVLIWLIKALKSNKNLTDNGEVHAANVEKVRLAAEKYFFIEDNKDKVNSVSLSKLQADNLVGEIVDANDKVCSENNTKAYLNNEIDTYTMTVSLSCSTNDKDEVFYYHKNTLACLNCDGKTNMTGKEIVVVKEDEKETNNNDTEESIDDKDDYNEYGDYSCISWTDWSKDRIFDPDLEERSKTLVQGVKYGIKKAYGDWSDYSLTPIVGNDYLEVETNTVTESVWSENKTGTDIDTTNPNIRVIATNLVNSSNNYCENGYIENNTCYSNDIVVGNLTMEEYTSGKYKVLKDVCEGVRTLPNSDGLYVLTYVNCEYNEAKPMTSRQGSSYTLYTYQELETSNVTYYRYRTVATVNEPDQYTDSKYEEDNLPEGYVKVDGTEETYYSYKLNVCEK